MYRNPNNSSPYHQNTKNIMNDRKNSTASNNRNSRLPCMVQKSHHHVNVQYNATQVEIAMPHGVDSHHSVPSNAAEGALEE